MYLKTILEIYPIYKHIIKYLGDRDIIKLYNVFPEIKYIFDKYGYKKKIEIYYNDIDRYIDCLHEFEIHKIWVKEIIAYDITTPFAFLPRCDNIVYSLFNCDNICRVPIYVKKLRIYTHRNINLYKLGLVCPDVEELYIDCSHAYTCLRKFTFKKLKKLSIRGVVHHSSFQFIPKDILYINKLSRDIL